MDIPRWVDVLVVSLYAIFAIAFGGYFVLEWFGHCTEIAVLTLQYTMHAIVSVLAVILTAWFVADTAYLCKKRK